MLKKKKVNRFYEADGPSIADIHYKNIDLLSKFITEQGKIIPRRTSGNDAKCQRMEWKIQNNRKCNENNTTGRS